MSKKKLIKDTFIYAIASFGAKSISFLLLPLYTNYFTSAEYGHWDLILTTTSLIIPFISFEMQSAVYRWLLEAKSFEDRQNIISTGFIYAIRNMLLSTTLALIMLAIYPINYGVFILVMINVSILNDFIIKSLRGLGYNRQFAIMGVLQTFTMIILNIVFIFVLKFRMETFFYSFIISYLIVAMIGWFILKFHQYLSLKRYSKSFLKSFIKYSIPMIPGAVNWWIMDASDRYIIAMFLGIDANGIYAVSYKLPAIIMLANSVFFLAWQDNAISTYKDKNRDLYYTSIFSDYFKLMLTSCIILILTGRLIIDFIVADKFFESWKYIGLLYVGTTFSAFSSFWGAGYHGSKETGVIFRTTLMGAIVNILINLSLINFIGLYAAAMSTAIGYIAMWLFRVFNKNALFKIKIEIKPFLILMVLVIISLCITLLESTIIDIIAILISVIVFIIFNRKIINSMINKAINVCRSIRNK
ncbi:MAG: polysaccharide biosynthesis C-terminal domain-containing protein [Clostridiales bacterium]